MPDELLKFLLKLDRVAPPIGPEPAEQDGPLRQWWLEHAAEPWLIWSVGLAVLTLAIWAYRARGISTLGLSVRTLLWLPMVAVAAGAATMALIAAWWWLGRAESPALAALRWGLPALAIGGLLGLYSRLSGSRPLRGLAAALRAAALAGVAAMLLGPAVAETSPPARGTVWVLVDDSRSQLQPDVPNVTAANPITRATAVRQALTADRAGFLRRLAANNRVQLASFSAGLDSVEHIETPEAAVEVVERLARLQADGAESRPPGAVIEALSRTAGQAPAAVIVLSDGRRTSGPAPAVAVARARAGPGGPVPIYAVGVGDPSPRRNVLLHQVVAESEADPGDPVEVLITVSAPGFPAGTRMDVSLIPGDGPEPIRTEGGGLPSVEPVIWGGGPGSITVRRQFLARTPGRYRLSARAAPLPGEIRTDDNQLPLTVEVRRRKLRVLLVEGRPRWEYRYLVSLLRREPDLDDSVLLLGSSPNFPQEGKRPLSRFPASAEELDEYHVVLLGDFDLDLDGPVRGLERPGLDRLAEWVRRGGGLGLIAGDGAGLMRWRDTPLAKVLPIEPAADVGIERASPDCTESFRLRLTERGRGHPILALPGLEPDNPSPGGPASQSPPQASVWERLPGWFWYYPLRRARPGAEVLAVHPTARAEDGGLTPIWVVGRYGAGPVLFMGGDETWRWRYQGGEFYFDAFWLQALRFLGREKLRSDRRPLLITVDRSAVRVGETVAVTGRVREPALQRRVSETGRLEVAVTAPDGAVRGQLTLRPEPREPSGSVVLMVTGRLTPDSAGTLVLRPMPVPELADPSAVPPVSLQVADAVAEDLLPEADPTELAALHEVAAELHGDGFCEWRRPFRLDELSRVAELIPPRRLPPAPPVVESVWDSPAPLLAVLLLLTVEWGLRKRLKLV